MNFKAIFTGAFLAVSMCSTVPANAWDIDVMNRHIDQTNFIVGRGCSGTLIDLENRLILTNHHCVRNEIRFKDEEFIDPKGVVGKRRVTDLQEVQVHQKTYDGHKVTASASYVTEIVGWDEQTDLALLQFRSDKLPFTLEATLSVEPVKRGETVWVVGNPLGLENTVMKGVVSSTNRLIQIGREEIPYIQVDAGITGGNSGGSLYNDAGLLVGVPGASARGTVVGLAVPNTFIMEFLDELCYTNVYSVTTETREECLEGDETEE